MCDDERRNLKPVKDKRRNLNWKRRKAKFWQNQSQTKKRNLKLLALSYLYEGRIKCGKWLRRGTINEIIQKKIFDDKTIKQRPTIKIHSLTSSILLIFLRRNYYQIWIGDQSYDA